MWDAVVEVTREDRSIREKHPAQTMRPSLTVFSLVESALVVQSLQLSQSPTLIDAIIPHLAQSSLDCRHCGKQSRLGVLLLREFFSGFSFLLCGTDVIVLRRPHLRAAFLPHYEFNSIISVIHHFPNW